ncbi:MAG: nitrogen fixation protein NifQ [Rhodoferax sp.]
MRAMGTDAYDLMVQAISGTLRNAQEGEIPLFAWTLGLSQPDYQVMLAQCLPELRKSETHTAADHARLGQNTPADFKLLASLLYTHRSPDADSQHADWLARTIAAACFGSRHLWQDLGLGGREDMSCLLRHYFTSLYALNIQSLKWKHFLFRELGLQRGQPGLRPPTCERCAHYPLCFPARRVERCFK